jgi:hypothetical protein
MKKIYVLLLIAVAISFASCESCERNTKDVETAVDPCADVAQIARLQAELECCMAENNDLKNRLTECLAEEEVVTKKVTVPKKTTVTKSAPKEATPVPQVKSVVEKKPVVAGKADLNYLRQSGEILFCVRVNNQEDCYFPHYAMQQGVQFNRYADNKVKGYNWRVEPTSFYDGDYGVTVDGTFYVSNGLIEKSLSAGGLPFDNVVEIKAPYTGWQLKAMTLEDGFWIFRTQ